MFLLAKSCSDAADRAVIAIYIRESWISCHDFFAVIPYTVCVYL